MYIVYSLAARIGAYYNFSMKARTIRDLLTWPVEEETCARGSSVTTDPFRKSHTLKIKKRGEPRIYLEHECAHAYLAETVHPLFSTPWFLPGTPETLIKDVEFAFRAATDWYADDLVAAAFAEEFGRRLRETFRRQLEAIGEDDRLLEAPTEILSYSLSLAQTEKYRIQVGATPPPSSSLIVWLRDAFLSRDPGSPSIRDLRGLLNDLLYPLKNTDVAVYRRKKVDLWSVSIIKP